MHEQPEVWRRYLSSTGVWMQTPDYLAQGAMVLAGLLALAGFLFWRNRRRDHSPRMETSSSRSG
jgi:MYXO-CTERM domain-containing protein